MQNLLQEVRSYEMGAESGFALNKPAYAMFKARLRALLDEQPSGSEDETIAAQVLRIVAECEIASQLLSNSGRAPMTNGRHMRDGIMEYLRSQGSPPVWVKASDIAKHLEVTLGELQPILNTLAAWKYIENRRSNGLGAARYRYIPVTESVTEAKEDALSERILAALESQSKWDGKAYHDLQRIKALVPASEPILLHKLKALEVGGRVDRRIGEGWRYVKWIG